MNDEVIMKKSFEQIECNFGITPDLMDSSNIPAGATGVLYGVKVDERYSEIDQEHICTLDIRFSEVHDVLEAGFFIAEVEHGEIMW